MHMKGKGDGDAKRHKVADRLTEFDGDGEYEKNLPMNERIDHANDHVATESFP
ncbi:hypothetical protein D3C75_1201560 [compost metagenome]